MAGVGGGSGALFLMALLLTASLCGVRQASALALSVAERECVYEYVFYEGDNVSGNFVVVDHEIFWGSDNPGINFEVCKPRFPFFFPLCVSPSILGSSLTQLLLMRTTIGDGRNMADLVFGSIVFSVRGRFINPYL